WNTISLECVTRVEDDTCFYRYEGISGKFSSPLLRLTPYQVPLCLAAAASCLLGIDPGGLATFPPVEGRLSLLWERGIPIVDDSNSGTNAATVREAIRYARSIAGPERPITLVIGKEDGAVCEGFPDMDIRNAISAADPGRVILVGEPYRGLDLGDREVSFCSTLEEGKTLALQDAANGCVVLAVKTWR
ncbi:MAG: coenzyme F430 synthase, partial [Methanolinea sp.]|nr:coenzyme F430 synthase [Methanolinea sp.]